ncbi:hypothetical protein ASPZODRAFT_150592 [Penicilliopsis zonata CBS 506.65]|uniref:LCCL domain-containing protein n=1 Tax=Penicilliopsis zonata CBS 506.65 TaxID=1073090 RepID=A0A1L9SMR6_9EURO|nr:hypothetical protein ASPZODRAFT_150592 [Penicilliopsis zonata CBS 506.65]OJJ48344.1 hypothetical protein ASPZODRAFT_150592 [Penicilliopsis zonata CBS 506.65]
MPVISRIVSIALRVAQIVFAAIVAGVIGWYLAHFTTHGNVWPQARWIYTEVVAGLSILLGLLWLIPFSWGFFSWPFDLVISFAWFAAFGILVNAIHKFDCGGVFRWTLFTNNSSCGRWKTAEAFSFLSAIVWLASALLHSYPLQSADASSPLRASLDSARSDPVGSDNDNREPLLPTHATHHTGEEGGGGGGGGGGEYAASRRSGRNSNCFLAWLRGPYPPRKHHIQPWFAAWQTAPNRLVNRYLTSRSSKIAAVFIAVAAWGIAFFLALRWSVTGLQVDGYGTPVRLSCYSNVWNNATDCGLDGYACRPFDGEAFAFRCPAGCSAAILLEPYTVGNEEVNYRHRVIGGGPSSHYYRGDSAICPAALHAGLVSDASGGCGILRRTGEQSAFESVSEHGITSIGFDSNFPLSFTFERTAEDGEDLRCQDLRWWLFGFSLAVTTVLSLFITSPAAFYASIFVIVFFQVALVSEPVYSPDFDEVVSLALGRFLPTALAGFVLYHFCVRHTLADLTAVWDRTVLWLGGCWVSALNRDTFDRIPISRLTPHDIQQQPGAIPALIVIISFLLLIVITQALAFRAEGRLPTMLRLYGLFLTGLFLLLMVPSMNLRIHHYILALLFLPGTTMQTRPCLLYQGILVGMFVNGIARWGYDSILQTPGALLEGGQLGSLLPAVSAPTVLSNHSLFFDFSSLTLPSDADGLNVLVNDVQRFQAYRDPATGLVPAWNWTRRVESDPEYFRFGYVKASSLGGVWYEDFTTPVVWEVDGFWNTSSRVNI